MMIHYLGIRHHGVGSAKRLLSALDEIQPDLILIEGPADCSDLLSYLTDRAMKPPIALLAYNDDCPDHHIYYPFTTYSPEYQAVQWANQNKAQCAFIDIPTDIKLNRPIEFDDEANTQDDGSDSLTASIDIDDSANEDHTIEINNDNDYQGLNQRNSEQSLLITDPIGILAKHAGYEDGESWWNDHFEQNFESNNQDSLALFKQIEDAMHALRESIDEDKEDFSEFPDELNSVREAYMRLEIVKHTKALEKTKSTILIKSTTNSDHPQEKLPTVAVVCGAWHVPALKKRTTQKDDKAIIKILPKKLTTKKIKRTWIPWTTSRLSRRSGYGAGVPAPMWYQHLWDYHNNPNAIAYWIGKIARSLRNKGHIVSTASVIEAVRLSHSLAIIRNRPQAGFEEIIDSVISCLCFGESILWQTISDQMLLGHDVGTIPENLPLAPLLEDLQKQQKSTKLKPETLARELSIDLRSSAGERRSILLHRLNLLNVPWGSLQGSGRSRGTFRENWLIQWDTNYSVQLIENLVYGNSIEQASNNKLIESLQQTQPLDKLAELVQVALTSSLEDATKIGLQRLNKQASTDTDIISLLSTLPHLINIARYGTARNIDQGQIYSLTEKLVIQSAVALPMACRNLNDDEAQRYRECLQKAHQSILLAELNQDLLKTWWHALIEIADNHHDLNVIHGLITGLTNRLLYQGDKINTDTLEHRLRYALSPAVSVSKASQFFDGFFSQAVHQLHYDENLLKTVNDWIVQLTEDDFMNCLPLFMRIFSELDKTERQRLLYQLLGRKPNQSIVYQTDDQLNILWEKHLVALSNMV